MSFDRGVESTYGMSEGYHNCWRHTGLIGHSRCCRSHCTASKLEILFRQMHGQKSCGLLPCLLRSGLQTEVRYVSRVENGRAQQGQKDEWPRDGRSEMRLHNEKGSKGGTINADGNRRV